MVDGSGADSHGSRRHHVAQADSAFQNPERHLSHTSRNEREPVSGREAWEIEREELVVTLHDRMRNPLSCLQGYVELLLDGVAGPLAHEQQALLERVRSATTRLATAVEEIVPRAVVPEE